MARLTTDPNDPDLGHGTDKTETGQNKAYLILSEEERKKGFVRPVRYSYTHVGVKPKYPLRDLTEEEQVRHAKHGYVKYEKYPEEESPLVGMFWTEEKLRGGCRTTTTMSKDLAETYARDPSFYGATYCCGCCKHIRVEEFVWDDGEIVGS